ncbi:hypothetical protein SBV1_340011 [Verrucomicrobia bacterium]|nr:hypothetical protein SBV1_340011 [Verrucomicrobiota bacterium]
MNLIPLREPFDAGARLGTRQPQRPNPLAWVSLAMIWLCTAAVSRADVVLDAWDFSDGTNWTSELGYFPLRFTNIINLPGVGDGNGLLLDTSNLSPAQLVFNTVEDSGATNINPAAGSISLWFKPDWSGTNNGGPGPGAWGRFVEIGTFTTNATADWWSIYLSPDGCELIFSAQLSNGSRATYLSAPVSLVSNTWNNIVVTYSATNSDCYLNSVFVTNGAGVTLVPGPAAMSNGFSIGSSLHGRLFAGAGHLWGFRHLRRPAEPGGSGGKI